MCTIVQAPFHPSHFYTVDYVNEVAEDIVLSEYPDLLTFKDLGMEPNRISEGKFSSKSLCDTFSFAARHMGFLFRRPRSTFVKMSEPVLIDRRRNRFLASLPRGRVLRWSYGSSPSHSSPSLSTCWSQMMPE